MKQVLRKNKFLLEDLLLCHVIRDMLMTDFGGYLITGVSGFQNI